MGDILAFYLTKVPAETEWQLRLCSTETPFHCSETSFQRWETTDPSSTAYSVSGCSPAHRAVGILSSTASMLIPLAVISFSKSIERKFNTTGGGKQRCSTWRWVGYWGLDRKRNKAPIVQVEKGKKKNTRGRKSCMEVKERLKEVDGRANLLEKSDTRNHSHLCTTSLHSQQLAREVCNSHPSPASVFRCDIARFSAACQQISQKTSHGVLSRISSYERLAVLQTLLHRDAVLFASLQPLIWARP